MREKHDTASTQIKAFQDNGAVQIGKKFVLASRLLDFHISNWSLYRRSQSNPTEARGDSLVRKIGVGLLLGWTRDLFINSNSPGLKKEFRQRG